MVVIIILKDNFVVIRISMIKQSYMKYYLIDMIRLRTMITSLNTWIIIEVKY